MLKIALTFDYELFFNDAFLSDKELLIDATYGIIDVLMNNQIRGTFFVETCMLQKFQTIRQEIEQGVRKENTKQIEAIETYNMVIDQIHTMNKCQFETGLHIHSIWNTAEWIGEVDTHRNDMSGRANDCKWVFHSEDYMPSSHPEKITIGNIEYGVRLLNRIAVEENAQNTVSFRAGGFSYEPSGLLFTTLYKYGIRLDSSVAKFTFKYAVNQRYNYKSVPKDVSYWRFRNGEICREEASKDSSYHEQDNYMIEIPVTAVRDIPFKWTLYRKHKKVVCIPKGTPSELLYNSGIERLREMIEKKFIGGIPLNMDSMHYLSMIALVKHYSQMLDKGKDCYIVAIGHPKFQDKITLDNIDKFIKKCKQEFDCRFMTMREMYEEIEGA